MLAELQLLILLPCFCSISFVARSVTARSRTKLVADLAAMLCWQYIVLDKLRIVLELHDS